MYVCMFLLMNLLFCFLFFYLFILRYKYFPFSFIYLFIALFSFLFIHISLQMISCHLLELIFHPPPPPPPPLDVTLLIPTYRQGSNNHLLRIHRNGLGRGRACGRGCG